MRLVHDNEVKMAYCKELLFILILDRIDAVHHRLIGGEHATGIKILLILTEIGHREVGQHIYKATLCLQNKRIAVGKEKDILHPTVIQQNLAKRNNSTGFARSRCHHKQRLAAIFLVKRLTNRLDSPLLVIAPRNMLVHHHVFEGGAHRVQIEQLFQVTLGVDRSHATLRVIFVVPNARIEAVGEENDRSAAVFLLQEVGVELGLLSALGNVHAGAFCFKNGKGLAVIAKENVISIAHLTLVGHAVKLKLIDPVLALRPAGILQHKIDVDLTRFVFRKVERLGHVGLLLLGAAGGQLLLERLVFLDQLIDVNIHLGHKRHGFLNGERKKRLIKRPLGVAGCVEIRHLVKEHEQVFKAKLCLLDGHFPSTVRCRVAKLTDEIHAVPNVSADNTAEFLGVHQADKGILIGHNEISVNGIHPLHRKLHRPAAIQHAGIDVYM